MQINNSKIKNGKQIKQERMILLIACLFSLTFLFSSLLLNTNININWLGSSNGSEYSSENSVGVQEHGENQELNNFNTNNYNNNLIPISSGSYSFSSLRIDDSLTINSTNYGNWTWVSQQPWCTGSGTLLDPYIVENITFTVAASPVTCLTIENSEYVHFIVRNITVNAQAGLDASGILIRNATDGTITNTTINTADNGIRINNSESIIVEDTHISSPGYGVKAEDSKFVSIKDIDIDNSVKTGIYFKSCNDSSIDNLFTSYAAAGGITLNKSRNINVTGSTILYPSQQGIYANESSGVQIEHNTIQFTAQGIKYENGEYITIKNNTVNYMEQNGIFLNYVNHTILEKNRISDCDNLGLWILNGTDIKVNFNIVTRNRWYYYYAGVILEELSGFECRNNSIYDNRMDNLDIVNSFDGIVADNYITKASESGIYLGYSSSIIVENNTVVYNNGQPTCGVFLSGSSDITIRYNNVSYNADHGIYIDLMSRDVLIHNNTINNNKIDGIYSSGANTTIVNNTIENNYGLGIKRGPPNCGITLEYVFKFRIENNYFKNNSFDSISVLQGSYGIITGNYIYSSIENGIDLLNSSDINITGNIIEDNPYSGILLNNTKSINICLNNISLSKTYGIVLDNASSGDISGNTIKNDYFGIFTYGDAGNNRIYLNYFINNTYHAENNNETNQWYLNGKGNYWDNYLSTLDPIGDAGYYGDLDDDGIGDRPYYLSHYGVDLYPLFNDGPNAIPQFLIPSSSGAKLIVQSSEELFNITYNISDPNYRDGTYLIYINNTLETSYSGPLKWDSDAQFTINFNLTAMQLNSGLYNLTLVANDGVGGENQSLTWVLINTPPKVADDLPEMFNFTERTGGNNISLLVVDDTIAHGTYTIYLNGSVYPGYENLPWTNNTPIEINIDGLSPGSYEFTVVITDGYGGQLTQIILVNISKKSNPYPLSPEVAIGIGLTAIVVTVGSIGMKSRGTGEGLKFGNLKKLFSKGKRDTGGVSEKKFKVRPKDDKKKNDILGNEEKGLEGSEGGDQKGADKSPKGPGSDNDEKDQNPKTEKTTSGTN